MSIKVTFPGNKKINALVNGFIIQTDQKKSDGGDETSPTPFEHFLVSMGTCAGNYVLGFCATRNISMEGIEIEQKAVYDDEKKKIQKLITEIQVPESFPKKYHQAVIKAANLCSVKKYIENPFEFETVTVVK